ncbi:MAG: hypothetical protein K1Y36_29810 [Blastocatellia bacterium]|nr:hypothetical protein [Blastocatellia bacterium]
MDFWKRLRQLRQKGGGGLGLALFIILVFILLSQFVALSLTTAENARVANYQVRRSLCLTGFEASKPALQSAIRTLYKTRIFNANLMMYPDATDSGGGGPIKNGASKAAAPAPGSLTEFTQTVSARNAAGQPPLTLQEAHALLDMDGSVAPNSISLLPPTVTFPNPSDQAAYDRLRAKMERVSAAATFTARVARIMRAPAAPGLTPWEYVVLIRVKAVTQENTTPNLPDQPPAPNAEATPAWRPNYGSELTKFAAKLKAAGGTGGGTGGGTSGTFTAADDPKCPCNLFQCNQPGTHLEFQFVDTDGQPVCLAVPNDAGAAPPTSKIPSSASGKWIAAADIKNEAGNFKYLFGYDGYTDAKPDTPPTPGVTGPQPPSGGRILGRYSGKFQFEAKIRFAGNGGNPPPLPPPPTELLGTLEVPPDSSTGPVCYTMHGYAPKLAQATGTDYVTEFGTQIVVADSCRGATGVGSVAGADHSALAMREILAAQGMMGLMWLRFGSPTVGAADNRPIFTTNLRPNQYAPLLNPPPPTTPNWGQTLPPSLFQTQIAFGPVLQSAQPKYLELRTLGRQ